MMPQADNTHALPANLPQLRFPEFKDAGVWEGKRLGDLCRIGDIDHRMPQTVSNGIPYLMTGDFTGINGLDFENAKLVSEKDYEQLSKKIKPELGDVLFARYASVGAVRYVDTNKRFLISYSCAIIKPCTFIEGQYLYYTLQSSTVQNKVEQEINTGSQRNIGIDSLKNLIFSVPKNKEQQKIAACLSSLDDLITTENQQLEALKTHKKGLMQSLFPAEGVTVPKFRFPEFKDAGAWSKKPIGAIGNFLGGGTPSKSNESFWKGNVPWISSSDISEDSIHKINITRFISDEALKESATKLVPENSILVVSRVGVGKLAITRSSVCTSQDFINLTPYADDIEFLGYLLKANGGDLESLGQGMAIKGFTKEDFSKYEIYLPSLGEQQKISACLSSLDDLISAHSQKIEALKQHKKGLMQQLFPNVVSKVEITDHFRDATKMVEQERH